jgi:transcriptional regulator with XRE-family HTH domain
MDNFVMEKKRKEMIATLVKEGRLSKGYTQKELSELSNISIRSIQRIENGEIIHSQELYA